MNYHLFQKDSQSVFAKKVKSKSKSGKKCHEHCTTFRCIALFHMKSTFTKFQRLHTSASLKIMLTAQISYISCPILLDDRPSRWADLLFSRKGGPLGTSTYHLQRTICPRHQRTAHPRLQRVARPRLQRATRPHFQCAPYPHLKRI